MEKIELIKAFLDFVAKPPQEEDKCEKLEYFLIEIYRFCLTIENHQGRAYKSNADYDVLRKMISQNFSELSYYNDVLEIKDNPGETELTVGDAIDDLTDIVKNFTDALSLKHEKDILSSLKLDFYFHTKAHFINLLRYLESDT